MPLPELVEPHGVLPLRIHRATIYEIRELFVDQAPHASQRRVIFEAFEVWVDSVVNLVPGGKIWIDGGFVQHKTWAPPGDIDVTYVGDQDLRDALDADSAEAFDKLFTDRTTRYKPMGGKVDAFWCSSTNQETKVFWKSWWTHVRMGDGSIDPAVRKGFVEVLR